MYLSEIIKSDVMEWKAGDIVLIDAPTGSGKTTAVLSEMRNEALRRGKEVLYISNRKLLDEQIKTILGKEIGYLEEDDSLYSIENFYGIKVTSYQKLQMYEKNEISILLDNFCFVVMDEFHYLLSDAMFQSEIYYFLKWIERCHVLRTKTVVMISATPHQSFEFLMEKTSFFGRCKERLRKEVVFDEDYCKVFNLHSEPIYTCRERRFWKYKIPQDLKTVMPYFYRDENSVVKLIEEDISDEKWLIFISQKTLGKFLYEQLTKKIGEKKVAFLSAEEVEKGNALVSKIVKNKKFDEKVLITTKVLENGVSLHDDKLKNIVVSTIWHDDFLQMIGRKRRERGEEIKIFMSCKSLNSFNGVRNKILLPLYSYIKVHPADRADKILNDVEYYNFAKRFMVYERNKQQYRINPAGKYVIKRRLDFVERMMSELKFDEKAFAREQLKWLDLSCDDYSLVTLEEKFQNQRKHEFEQYLQKRYGERMDKEKQINFRNYFKEMFGDELNLKQNLPGMCVINEFLKVNSIYIVISEIESRKTIWGIEKRNGM